MFDKKIIDSLQITKENDIECYVRSGLYESVYTHESQLTLDHLTNCIKKG